MKQGKKIFDFIIHALQEHGSFYRVIPLEVGSKLLKVSNID
jgi:hypothetical protein